MMHLVIIGGGGYIGTRLLQLLELKNYRVTVIDTFWFWESKNQWRDAVRKNGKRVTIYSVDDFYFGTPAVVEMVLSDEENTAIINLAALANDISAEIDPLATHRINYDVARRVVNLADQYDHVRRLIHISSGSVYGACDTPVTDGTPPDPITQYAGLKLAIDNYITSYIPKEKYVILRPGTVFGWSPRMRLDLFLNAMCYAAVNDRVFIVNGGQQIRPTIYIDDLCLFIIQCIYGSGVAGGVINVASNSMSILDYAAIMQEYIPQFRFTVDSNVSDERSWDLDVNYFSSIVNHVTTPLHIGLGNTCNAIRAQKVTDNKWHYNVCRMKEVLNETA